MNLDISILDAARAAETALLWIGQAVVFGTILAALTLGIAKILGHRVRPAVHGALWLVVLLKFVIPAGPSFSMSMATVGDRLMSRFGAGSESFAGALAANAAVESFEGGLLIDRPAAENAAIVSPKRWMVVLATTYFATVACVAALRLRAYRRFVRRCRALPRVDESTQTLVGSICGQAGLRRRIDVFRSDEAPAPFVFGAIRPTLVLSRRQLVRPDALEAVILHEVAHLRRGDLLVRYVQWLAGTLLFFWPVVAWVNRRIDLALEHACDEWALRLGRISAGEYARCLLDAASVGSRSRAGLFEYRPAAMAANVRFLERRIEMILDTPRSGGRALGLTASLAVAVWAAFALSGAATADTPPGESADVSKNAYFNAELHESLSEEEMAAHQALIERKMVEAARRHEQMAALDAMRASLIDDEPYADLDADGSISRHEFAAFLAGLAVSDAGAVLERFPGADRNEDGLLSDDEAVRLVSPQVAVAFGHPVEGELALELHRRAAVKLKLEAERAHAEADGEAIVKLEKLHNELAFGMPEKERMELHLKLQHQGQIAFEAAVWLMENVDVAPTVEDLRALFERVEQPPIGGALTRVQVERVNEPANNELILIEVEPVEGENVRFGGGEGENLQFGNVELILEPVEEPQGN